MGGFGVRGVGHLLRKFWWGEGGLFCPPLPLPKYPS